MGRTLLYLLLALALPVSAQIYKYTDANGNTAYSSQPPDGIAAKTLELPPLNSVETQKPGVAAPVQPITAQPANALQSAAPYSAFELTDIPTEEALRANNGTFTVGVKIEPRLQRRSAEQRPAPATGERRPRRTHTRRAGPGRRAGCAAKPCHHVQRAAGAQTLISP